jgi:hypothetical protein
LWLLDDAGKPIMLLQDMAFFSYSRTVRGFGTIMIGMPYQEFRKKIFPVFQVDWRVQVMRSPKHGAPMREEQTYWLRKPEIYKRETDGVEIIRFYGRDGKDLLRRRYVIQAAGFSQTRKTDFIDDMMKEIVREQMLYGSALDETGVVDNTRAYPEDEFLVQGEVSLGPSITATFADRQVLDVLKELQDASFQLNEDDPLSNSRIYFDVIPFDAQGRVEYILDEDCVAILDEDGWELLDEESAETRAIQGFKFVTFADLRGQDRTESALVFSVENDNLEGPDWTQDFFEEENSIIVKGFGRGDSRAFERVDDAQRIGASRWNLNEGYEDASTEPDQDNLADFGYARLHEGRPKEEIDATFLNVPGGPDTPRSLYGVDWDLGDLLPVEYAGKRFNVEVMIVYVSVDQDGLETITGRSDISVSDQA